MVPEAWVGLCGPTQNLQILSNFVRAKSKSGLKKEGCENDVDELQKQPTAGVRPGSDQLFAPHVHSFRTEASYFKPNEHKNQRSGFMRRRNAHMLSSVSGSEPQQSERLSHDSMGILLFRSGGGVGVGGLDRSSLKWSSLSGEALLSSSLRH